MSASEELHDPADRERSRLLAGLLLALLVLGLGSGVLQWLLIPGFWPTFAAMLLALAVIAGAYVLSRTRHFRKAAWAAAGAPIAACAVVTRSDPTDAVSGTFMLIGVLIATLFLDARAALGVACGALAALVLALDPWQVPFEPRRAVPLLAFHAVVSPLLLIVAAHRDRIEELRKEAQRKAQAAPGTRRGKWSCSAVSRGESPTTSTTCSWWSWATWTRWSDSEASKPVS